MTYLVVLDVVGTIAFAVSGALTAMQRKMDLFGIFIIGFVTAIGGGTLRDILTGNTPVIWMENTDYVYIIGGSVILSIILRKYLNHLTKSLFLFDTIGLGVFTILGVEAGIRANLPPIVCLALGAMTGCFGGVIRDTLCNRIPVIFRKEIYATASLAGGACFLGLYNLNLGSDAIYITTVVLIIAIRLLVVKYSISLPTFYVSEDKTPE